MLSLLRSPLTRTQKLIECPKRDHIKEQIQDKHSPKKLWKTLKSLGAANPGNKSVNIGLNVIGSITFDKNKVANKFNFTTVAAKMVEKLPRACGLYGVNHVCDSYRSKGVTPGNCKFKK